MKCERVGNAAIRAAVRADVTGETAQWHRAAEVVRDSVVCITVKIDDAETA